MSTIIGPVPEYLRDMSSSIHDSVVVTPRRIGVRHHETFTDLIFLCSDGEVHGHKAMLLPHSALLKSIVSASPQASDAVFSLPDIDQLIMNKMIEFVYQGKAEFDKDQDRAKLLELVYLLDFDKHVKEKITLTEMINAENMEHQVDGEKNSAEDDFLPEDILEEVPENGDDIIDLTQELQEKMEDGANNNIAQDLQNMENGKEEIIIKKVVESFNEQTKIDEPTGTEVDSANADIDDSDEDEACLPKRVSQRQIAPLHSDAAPDDNAPSSSKRRKLKWRPLRPNGSVLKMAKESGHCDDEKYVEKNTQEDNLDNERVELVLTDENINIKKSVMEKYIQGKVSSNYHEYLQKVKLNNLEVKLINCATTKDIKEKVKDIVNDMEDENINNFKAFKRILDDSELYEMSSKRKRVSFGPQVSPEIFDKSLPSDTPVRKGGGGTPRTSNSSASALTKSVLVRRENDVIVLESKAVGYRLSPRKRLQEIDKIDDLDNLKDLYELCDKHNKKNKNKVSKSGTKEDIRKRLVDAIRETNESEEDETDDSLGQVTSTTIASTVDTTVTTPSRVKESASPVKTPTPLVISLDDLPAATPGNTPEIEPLEASQKGKTSSKVDETEKPHETKSGKEEESKLPPGISISSKTSSKSGGETEYNSEDKNDSEDKDKNNSQGKHESSPNTQPYVYNHNDYADLVGPWNPRTNIVCIVIDDTMNDLEANIKAEKNIPSDVTLTPVSNENVSNSQKGDKGDPIVIDDTFEDLKSNNEAGINVPSPVSNENDSNSQKGDEGRPNDKSKEVKLKISHPKENIKYLELNKKQQIPKKLPQEMVKDLEKSKAKALMDKMKIKLPLFHQQSQVTNMYSQLKIQKMIKQASLPKEDNNRQNLPSAVSKPVNVNMRDEKSKNNANLPHSNKVTPLVLDKNQRKDLPASSILISLLKKKDLIVTSKKTNDERNDGEDDIITLDDDEDDNDGDFYKTMEWKNTMCKQTLDDVWEGEFENPSQIQQPCYKDLDD